MEISAKCNWTRSGGCDLCNVVQTKITHEDIFIKPELDDMLNEDRGILLTAPVKPEPCELELKVFPPYKIESLSLVCNVSKVELFSGAHREYMETVYGTIISDSDDTNEMLCNYRYDIEVEKSGVVELAIKMLTATNEICIYGAILQIAPNPNGITTLLPNATINLENVQQMLNSSGQKLSPNAEKCKMFMEMYNKNLVAKSSVASPNTDAATALTLLEQMRQALALKPLKTAEEKTSIKDSNIKPEELSSSTLNFLENALKAHVDLRFSEFEARINARLHAMESEQTAKLDSILKLLVERNK